MADGCDVAVIGAGVVGLAVARALARAGREVLILEAAESFGTETSSRNSEVIHAGLYYPTGSAKARLCVAGRHRLYAFCAAHGVAVRRCGKVIVATGPEQLPALDRLEATARANAVEGIARLDAAGARALEPEVACTQALFSAATGILDSHAFMLAVLGEAEAAGAVLVRRAPVRGGRLSARGIELDVGGADPISLDCRLVVNAAGLDAPALARRIAGIPGASIPPDHLAKGHYFLLAGRNPFRHLVYPLPEAAGLGVHVTLDLAGSARFGPDVEWVDTRDYAVDPARAPAFEAAIRRYWPGLPDGALIPGYAGIRPKITPPGAPAADFHIAGPADHGVPGWVALYGIESPGLTASLAIGAMVAALATGADRAGGLAAADTAPP